MKRSIKLGKCWKCGWTKEELEKVELTLERMAAYIPVGGPKKAEGVIEVCSKCLDDAGLKPIN